MQRFQDGSYVVDQMTRLKLKLLEKENEALKLSLSQRLENQKHQMDDRAESAQSARIYDGQMEALHRALKRKQHLLQRLREQHILENLNRPHTWGGSQQHQSHFITAPQPPSRLPPMAATNIHQTAPILSYLPTPPPALPPRIIQQTLPQQPATIIQQLPQQQPVITQTPPPQTYPASRTGSIKEDMVELMLMQNAQMHQIIMHNMMLRAMPPMALMPPAGPSHCAMNTAYPGQDNYQANPNFIRSNMKPRGNAVHHHHYSATTAAPQLPPISLQTWLPVVPSIPAGQVMGHLPSLQVAATSTLP